MHTAPRTAARSREPSGCAPPPSMRGIASRSAPASRHSCAAWRQTSEARSRIPATSASKRARPAARSQRSHRGIVPGSREFSPPHMMHRLAVQLRHDGTVSFRDAYRSYVRVSRYVIASGCPGPHLCRGAGHVKPPRVMSPRGDRSRAPEPDDLRATTRAATLIINRADSAIFTLSTPATLRDRAERDSGRDTATAR